MTAPAGPSWPPPLDDLYDRRTLAAFDSGVEPRADHDHDHDCGHGPYAGTGPGRERPRGGWRGSLAGGAVLTGLALGLQEVFDADAAREAVFEVAPDPGLCPVDGVTLFFVPGDPQGTVAVVDRQRA